MSCVGVMSAIQNNVGHINETFQDFALKIFDLEGDPVTSRPGKPASSAGAVMGVSATPAMDSTDDLKMRKIQGDSAPLPKHSYWFDLWVFLVFDVVLFFFVYFVVP